MAIPHILYVLNPQSTMVLLEVTDNVFDIDSQFLLIHRTPHLQLDNS